MLVWFGFESIRSPGGMPHLAYILSPGPSPKKRFIGLSIR